MSEDEEEEELERRRNEVVYLRGTKEDFISLLHASHESNNWVRKFRDYDCYARMLGPLKIHDTVAKTRAGDYVGSCICLEFEEFAFVGVYYVRPEYRKRGIGTELFARTVTESLRLKNVGLHSAAAMSPIFERTLGFSHRASWRVEITKLTEIDLSKIDDSKSGLSIKDGREVGLESLIDYDEKVSKSRREAFLRFWAIERNDAVCKVAVNSSNEVVGYGCARLMSIVAYPALCPIYADNDDAFLVLFHALASCFTEELSECNTIDMRITSEKASAVHRLLARVAQFKVIAHATPQFTKCVPEHDIKRIYCIAETNVFI